MSDMAMEKELRARVVDCCMEEVRCEKDLKAAGNLLTYHETEYEKQKAITTRLKRKLTALKCRRRSIIEIMGRDKEKDGSSEAKVQKLDEKLDQKNNSYKAPITGQLAVSAHESKWDNIDEILNNSMDDYLASEKKSPVSDSQELFSQEDKTAGGEKVEKETGGGEEKEVKICNDGTGEMTEKEILKSLDESESSGEED